MITLAVHTLQTIVIHSVGVQDILIQTLAVWNITFHVVIVVRAAKQRVCKSDKNGLISIISAIFDNADSRSVIRNFYVEIISYIESWAWFEWETTDQATREKLLRRRCEQHQCVVR